jgi:hypothetical protein
VADFEKTTTITVVAPMPPTKAFSILLKLAWKKQLFGISEQLL